MSPRYRWIALALVLTSLVSVSCASGDAAGAACNFSETPPAPKKELGLSAQVATTDMYVGPEQRFEIGVFQSQSDGGVRLLSFGKICVTIQPLKGGENNDWTKGPEAIDIEATYLGAPGTQGAEDVESQPSLTAPDKSRGVYYGDNVRPTSSGYWEAVVTADIEGLGVNSVGTVFNVADQPSLPAPGDRALKSKNLTVDTPGVKLSSLDSRAQGDTPLPDPELHQWTIADAIKQGRPALVAFGTPVYCASQFCAPITDELQKLAEKYPKKAVYIHIEIYRRYDSEGKALNITAGDWLYRDGNLTEPWLYLIGANGRILDRWQPLFSRAEVEDALAALPDMKPLKQ